MQARVTRTLIAGLTSLLLLAAPISASARDPSTSEERDEAVKLASYLEGNPLAADAPDIRQSLIGFYQEAPDIVVPICYFLGPLQNESHPFLMDLIRQTLISSGAFIIQNPDRAKDNGAVYIAGLEGALKAYKSFVEAKPDGRLPFVDELLQKRAAGQLEQYVRDELPKNCNE